MSKKIITTYYTDVGPIKILSEPKKIRQTFGDKVANLVAQLLDANYHEYEGSYLNEDDYEQIKQMVDNEWNKIRGRNKTKQNTLETGTCLYDGSHIPPLE